MKLTDPREEEWYRNAVRESALEELHFAASRGDLEKVKSLIESGRDINAFDQDLGWTPLHHAANEEKHDVMDFLVQAGADVNAHDAEKIGETPLGLVAADCSYQTARILIDAGADPTISGWMQITALHRASERKKEEGTSIFSGTCDLWRHRQGRRSDGLTLEESGRGSSLRRP